MILIDEMKNNSKQVDVMGDLNDDHKSDGTSDHGIVKAVFEYNPVKYI